MTRTRETTPTGHGEVLARPDITVWAEVARANREAARGWSFEVAGVPAEEWRVLARREAVAAAQRFSAKLAVPLATPDADPDLLLVTGHQPEFYHPGVWVKDFLLQRLADETGAAAIDLVVDSDGFNTLAVHSPCLRPDVRACESVLAVGTSDGCFGCAPVPEAAQLDTFIAAAAENLVSLPAPSLSKHFARFGEILRAAASDVDNLAELVTIARRRYEAAAGTDYLELPVSTLARSRAFAHFVVHLTSNARAFACDYNDALGDFRERTGARNSAQPFPDLDIAGDLVELPLWALGGQGRRPVFARVGERPALVVEGEVVCELAGEPSDVVERLVASRVALAPKALALTLFTRLAVADLFIHGVGGGSYDQVTDEVIRRHFGVEPPAIAVASMTVYLPLGAPIVSNSEVEAAAMALNRLQHNPDQMLDEVEFESAAEHARAVELAGEKTELVIAIGAPDADKKTLGRRIREVNAELAELLRGTERQLRADLEELKRLQAARDVLTDRTYPFCLWDPCEIADKVR